MRAQWALAVVVVAALGLGIWALERPDSGPPVEVTVVASGAEAATEPQDPVETPEPVPWEPPIEAPSSGAMIEDELNTIDVFEKMAPATVFVSQNKLVWSYDMTPMEAPTGSGTGFIWDDEGHIVTNYHVVNGGEIFTVRLFNQKSYEATFIGGEPRKDIAVLKIEAPPEELHSIKLPPKEHEMRVGQKTLAIGNPFGLEHTLTVGVVSALERDVVGFSGLTIRGMVQTDASINPGNSGGPLLDSSGQLIGMNSMIFSRSGSSAGIGFAVPVSTIRKVVPQIIESGKAEQVGIGISPISDAQARRAGIKGVVIRSVLPDSPAEKAGLKGMSMVGRELLLGDIIVGIDGEPVVTFDNLYSALDGRAPGEEVKVTILRNRKKKDVEVELYVLP